MDETLPIETAQALDLLEKHGRALKYRPYREQIQEESNKDLHVDTKSKFIALEEMVSRDLGFGTTVSHPRIWLLRTQNNGAAQKNHGTPPVSKLHAQGQFPSRTSSSRAKGPA
ncbi:hypothetical protein PGTUg99_017287 [Puccinia graminis f. sp. tritici]|uniref:Uncharacterized protein n=1 Tax=Puccinia graminis f. sp. tritici TaxID=56615 RepID=A0A5B0PCH7_PUCGR|nr:hypothetical protein PGTUg99_017287 [Puccinia graminis f. sp. tritici]